jgi:GMP synthase (glutamine-hydrolysing)
VRVLSVTHQDNAGAGVFGQARGAELLEWSPLSGEPPPLDGIEAAMVFGGAMHVDQEHQHAWLRGEKELIRLLLERGTPLLGVCLGSQLLAEAAGARPRPLGEAEIGWRRVEVTEEGRADPVIGPLAPSFEVFEWHSYEAPLPPGAVALARNSACLQAFRVDDRPAWGVQFHAEVTAAGLGSWLDGWHESADALATRQDPDAIRSESERRIDAQNELGRELAERFLAQAREAGESVLPKGVRRKTRA